MKKQRLKTYLKLGILLFGISYLFINCEQESINNDENTQSKYTISRINANEIQNNNNVFEKIASIESEILGTKGSAKSSYDNVQFSIDLNEATYIEATDGTYHSYTFGIYNEEDNYNINNIVLSLTENGDYQADLVTYTLTQDERNLIDNGIEIDLTYKTTIEPFDINQINSYGKNGGTCMEFVNVGTDCPCQCYYTGSGECTDPVDVYEWQSVPCDDGGGGPTNPSPGNGNPNNNGGTSGGTTSTPKPKATSLTNPDGTQVNDDIQKLNILKENTLIKSRITQMTTELNTSTTEQGSEFRTTATTNVYSELQITGTDLQFDTTKFPDAISSSRVRLHMHHNSTVNNKKIQTVFSAGDIFGMAHFYKQKKDLNDTDREEITSILLSRSSLYALRIDDAAKVEQFYESLNTNVVFEGEVMKNKDKYKKIYQRFVIENTKKYCSNCTDEQEAAIFEGYFTKFFKYLDSGLSLFYSLADADGNYTWSELN